MNEFEAVTNLANGPIIFTYYAEKELSISTIQQAKKVISKDIKSRRKSYWTNGRRTDGRTKEHNYKRKNDYCYEWEIVTEGGQTDDASEEYTIRLDDRS